METVHHRADGAARACRGGEQFAPVGAAHIAAAGDVNFAGFQIIERLGEQAERLFLRAMHVNHQHGHRATGDDHGLAHGLHGLREKLMILAQRVEDVAHDGRVEFGADQIKQLGVIAPLRLERFFGRAFHGEIVSNEPTRAMDVWASCL